MINDTDKLLVNDGSKTETITFQELAESLDTKTPPVINTVTLFEDDTTGDRFTNQSFTTTVVMEEDGNPPSNKSIRGTVGSDLKYKFGPIESVNNKQVIYSDPANFSSPDDGIDDPEKAFNGRFGVGEKAQTKRVGNKNNVKTLQFTFPEPLFVEDGIELVIPIKVSATELQYKINNIEYTASFDVRETYENGNTTVDMPGGLNNEIFYVQEDQSNQNIEMYDKYIKPYIATSGEKTDIYYLLRMFGPFEFLKYKSLSRKNPSNGNDTKAKLFGIWLGDHWLNDDLGVTELVFDNSQASNIANVKTNDYIVEVGNGDDGVGTVAYTQYIGDALGSTQNKIVLSQIEPNWDAGSDVASPADTALQYLVLDNDLNVTGLQATETDFTPFTGTASQIKFGPNLGTLNAPDDVLPEGTSIQTEVKASNNIVPDSTKKSNSITPAPSPCVSGPFNTDELIDVSADGLTLTFDSAKDFSKIVVGSSIEQTPTISRTTLLDCNYHTDFNSTGLPAQGNVTVANFDGVTPLPEIVTFEGYQCLKIVKASKNGRRIGSALWYKDWSSINWRQIEVTFTCWFYLPSDYLLQNHPQRVSLIHQNTAGDGKSFSPLCIETATTKLWPTNIDVPLNRWNKFTYIHSPSENTQTFILNDESATASLTGLTLSSQTSLCIGMRENGDTNDGRSTSSFYLRDLVVSDVLNPTGVVQGTNSDTNQIILANKYGDWGPTSSGYSAEGFFQCPSVFTPLYLENPEDVAKFNAIKESLAGYQGDRLNFRAELRKRLVENGFTMKDIYNLGLLKTEDATAWSVDTGYNQGSLVSYNDEYWFALSSSYNNSPDDNDPLDWEDLILQ